MPFEEFKTKWLFSANSSLVLFILGAGVVHLGFFYFVRIDTVKDLAYEVNQPKEISFLMRSSVVKDAQASLDWVALKAPAILSAKAVENLQTPSAASLREDIRTTVSRLRKTAPLSSDEKENAKETTDSDIALWSKRQLMAGEKASPIPLPVETPPMASGTVVQLSGDVKSRKIVKEIKFPQPSSTIALKRTVIRFSLNERGFVENMFLEESSGAADVDQQAQVLLHQWRFRPDENQKGLMWGKALIFWDIQAKPSASAKSIRVWKSA